MSDVDYPPVRTHAQALRSDHIKRGFLKCRLVHMKDRSFVMPDLLFSAKMRGEFFAARFFTGNQIAFFGGDGSADFCHLAVDLMNGTRVQVAFFRNDVVRTCRDGSVIYRCAFSPTGKKAMPQPCGKWRRRGKAFELLLYHHTNSEAEKGIRASGELWSSPWNIQGSKKLENISYCYFTSIPSIRSEEHLRNVAMSQAGVAHFLPTNAPCSPEFASALEVPKRTPKDMGRSLGYWIDVEDVSPNHLWFHQPMFEPAYYEVVLPRVYRVGVEPGHTLPIDGKRVQAGQSSRKLLNYVVVGLADSPEGLAAPYNEEETLSLAKIDAPAEGEEIISTWKAKKNSHQYSEMPVEVAQLAGQE